MRNGRFVAVVRDNQRTDGIYARKQAKPLTAHESPRTTKLYDRRSDVVSLDEVKVVF
jgi:hypothetical protein